MLVFLLIKLIRGDFRYWLNLPNALSLFVSFVIRVVNKVLADFTLMMQMRHSFEVGGVQFSFLVMQNQAMCFVAAKLYLEYFDGAYETEGEDVRGDRTLEAETLWAGLLGLLGLFLVSSSSFVYVMDRKYLHTFFTTMTGKVFLEFRHNNSKTDFEKIKSFNNYPTFYENVKEDLQLLLDENWEDWMTDRPEWLTDNVIATIPDEYLKKADVNRLEDEGGGKRRRSLGFRGMGGGGAQIVSAPPPP